MKMKIFFLYQHLQEDKTVILSKNKQKGKTKNKKQRLNFTQHFPQKIHSHKKYHSLETCAWLLFMLLQDFFASAILHRVHYGQIRLR